MMMIAATPASRPASPMSQLELPSSPLAPLEAEVARAPLRDCAAEAAIGVITIVAAVRAKAVFRSEEHTSELQSLMRISYAVFCLKKKKTCSNKNKTNTQRKMKNNTNNNTHIILPPN